jgi:hypothetical protein
MATICTVSGNLVDGSNTAIESEVITAKPLFEQFATAENILVPIKSFSATSDSSGDWTLEFMRSVSTKKYLVIIATSAATGSVQLSRKIVTIPDTATADFVDL